MHLRQLTIPIIALAFIQCSGCITIVDRGTRGGKISALSAVIVEKGDKREKVIARLGEPDDIDVIGNIEYMTYRAVKGGYYVVYGVFEHYTLRVTLENGTVTQVANTGVGTDTFILTSFGGGVPEPGGSR